MLGRELGDWNRSVQKAKVVPASLARGEPPASSVGKPAAVAAAGVDPSARLNAVCGRRVALGEEE